jgi:hypothetical protein
MELQTFIDAREPHGTVVFEGVFLECTLKEDLEFHEIEIDVAPPGDGIDDENSCYHAVFNTLTRDLGDIYIMYGIGKAICAFKGASGNGNFLMRFTDALARCFKAKTSSLLDTSTITLGNTSNVSFPGFRMLTQTIPQTWYEDYGFFSEAQKTTRENVLRFRKQQRKQTVGTAIAYELEKKLVALENRRQKSLMGQPTQYHGAVHYQYDSFKATTEKAAENQRKRLQAWLDSTFEETIQHATSEEVQALVHLFVDFVGYDNSLMKRYEEFL